MVIKIISITNKLSNWEHQGLKHFTKQFPKSIKIDFVSLKSQQHAKRSKKEIMHLEEKLILSKLANVDSIISWDCSGQQINSFEFSNFIKTNIISKKNITFIIGGSFGLTKKIIKDSDLVFSASNLTFPHKIFKILVVEQIYRALSIINNSPYHK